MLLCVDATKIPRSPSVNCDVELGDILLNNTRYYQNAQVAEAVNYVPLRFCTSVRTCYSNKVLQITENDQFFYYAILSNKDILPHKGYDLLMYLSAVAFLSFVNYDSAVDDIMMKYSTIKPLGLYNPDASLFSPLVYSHIILADEAEKEIQPLLKPYVEFVTLDEMNQRGVMCPLALLNTFKYVEKESEQDE